MPVASKPVEQTFKGTCMRVFAIVLSLILPLLACAEDTAKYKEGEHYIVIAGQPQPAKTGKIEVTELFWYGCGHCYAFEPLIQKWKAGIADDVQFIGSPAVWRDAMGTHAKLYYTAKSMGVLDKLHSVFFETLHKAPRPTAALVNAQDIAATVSKHGVDGDLFVKTMDSFAVNSQVQQAIARQKSYKISGTPEMVVAGYYLVSSSKAGGHKEMLEVVDYLVDKIRTERSGG